MSSRCREGALGFFETNGSWSLSSDDSMSMTSGCAALAGSFFARLGLLDARAGARAAFAFVDFLIAFVLRDGIAAFFGLVFTQPLSSATVLRLVLFIILADGFDSSTIGKRMLMLGFGE
jgi:hypothetical protein